MQQFFAWIESTGLATTVGESLSMTAWLSAIHLIGFTLVMSGGLLWNLHASGVLLSGVPARSIARPAVVVHALMRRMPARADSGRPAGFVRAAGMLSILFWGAVILCGRLMSYTLF